MAGQDEPGEPDRRKVLLLDVTGSSRELVLALRERPRAALGAENVSHGRVADDSQTVLVLIDGADRPERIRLSAETLLSAGRTVLPVLLNGAPLPFPSERAFTLSPDHLDEDAATLITFLFHRSSWPGQAPSMRD